MLLEIAAFAVLVAATGWISLSAWRRSALPDAALPAYLLIASVALRPTVRWGNVSLARNFPEWLLLALTLAVSAWVLATAEPRPGSDRDKRVVDWPTVALSVFALVSIPGWIRSTDQIATMTWWVRLVVALVALIATRRHLTGAQRLAVLRNAGLWLVVAVAVAVTAAPQANIQIQTELPFFDLSSRVPLITSRDLGWFGFGVLAWGAIVTTRRRWLVVSAGIIIIAAAQHRAGLAHIMVVGLATLPGLSRGVRRLAVGLAALTAAVLIWPTTWSPLYGGGAASNLLSARRGMWNVGLAESDVAPWFGRGMNSVVHHELRPLFERDYEHIRQIHNTWLDVHLGSGVFAAVALVVVVATIVRLTMPHLHTRAGRLAGVVLGAAVIESMLSSSLDHGSWILIAVLLATPVAHERVDAQL